MKKQVKDAQKSQVNVNPTVVKQSAMIGAMEFLKGIKKDQKERKQQRLSSGLGEGSEDNPTGQRQGSVSSQNRAQDALLDQQLSNINKEVAQRPGTFVSEIMAPVETV